ncbi:MAG TPA: anti-sigma regulatory factor [Armatimonadetes bacterium]|nr:anti-sigma regulatory factor [Armatimonadota bacterium]
MAQSKRIPVKNDLDIVSARVEGRNMARALGFGVIDQARIATAISELARNVILYAESGEVELMTIEADGRRGIQIVCRDRGPGIADIELVMQDGYSTQRGLGMGLPGTRRLMDEFEISSEVNVGTIVTVRKWLK